MGWFLVIVGAVTAASGLRVNGLNGWQTVAAFAAFYGVVLTIMALGVAVNQGWLS